MGSSEDNVGVEGAVSILFFWHLWILLQMIKLLNWISLCQLTIAGIKYTGMYSPMHSSNKV